MDTSKQPNQTTMYTIQKTWTDYPAAHRQPNHKGHCSLIHGHNWGFTVTLKSDVLDKNGFVHDFGDFKAFKGWLDDVFDHTLLLQEDDPLLTQLQTLPCTKIRVLPGVSCEKIAQFVYERTFFYEWGKWVESVTVTEDSKNSATYGN